MKKIAFISKALMLISAVTIVSACSSDVEDDYGASQATKYNSIALTSTLKTTRSTSDPQATQLNTEVKVGVYAVSGDACISKGDNNQHAVDVNGDLSTSSKMVWPSAGSVNIYAYAPYNADWTYTSETKTFSVAIDQTTDAGYLASDLVYGLPTSNPVSQTESAVPLTFSHKLAKINISIRKASDATIDLSAATVTVMNTKTATTFDVKTGSVGTATGDATDISVVSALGQATTACAIIVPQEIAAGTRLVKIAAGGKILYAKLGSATAFVGGKSYNFTVNIGSTEEPVVEVTLALGSTSVVSWDDEDLGAADADDKLYAEFGTPGGNAGYDATTYTYTWSASSNNLMNCFTFENGELANYTTLNFTFSEITEEKAVRINILYSDNTNNDNNYYSVGTKNEAISKLLKEGKTAADVTAIRFGGANVSASAGSCVIKASEMYLE